MNFNKSSTKKFELRLLGVTENGRGFQEIEAFFILSHLHTICIHLGFVDTTLRRREDPLSFSSGVLFFPLVYLCTSPWSHINLSWPRFYSALLCHINHIYLGNYRSEKHVCKLWECGFIGRLCAYLGIFHKCNQRATKLNTIHRLRLKYFVLCTV
jgi:hypothetical protein